MAGDDAFFIAGGLGAAGQFYFFRCLRQGFDLKAALLGHHILIRHCENYPGLDRDYYRIAVRTEAENRRFIAALTDVLQG